MENVNTESKNTGILFMQMLSNPASYNTICRCKYAIEYHLKSYCTAHNIYGCISDSDWDKIRNLEPREYMNILKEYIKFMNLEYPIENFDNLIRVENYGEQALDTWLTRFNISRYQMRKTLFEFD